MFLASCLLIVSVVVGVCWTCTGPIVMTFPAAEGTVVDGTTDQPISGAVVVATWTPYQVLAVEGHHPAATVAVSETVTDNLGKFHIDPPRPRLRKPWHYLPKSEPRIFVFRRGYRYAGVYLRQILLTPDQTRNDSVGAITRARDLMADSNPSYANLPLLAHELLADRERQTVTPGSPAPPK
ncbi:MAG: hypothetical protein QOK37_4382 [Thermoanaerobaculia bacterium]|jgi:hypothetical protein|nr:hypothetical protein [Thermoanaerobaculia bacterium]